MIITSNYTIQPSIRYASLATNVLTLDVDTSLDTTEPIRIALPSIASLQDLNAQRIEIIVNDFSNNSADKPITILPYPEGETPNTIQGRESLQITNNGASAMFRVASNSNWLVDQA